MASVEGKRGTPRPRPPFPAERGLWGCPTLINKNASVTLAYANLGTIATIKNQQGIYLSGQIGF